MMSKLIILFALSAQLVSCASTAPNDQSALIEYDGKIITRNDLDPKSRQKIYNADNEHYISLSAALSEVVVNKYFEEQAAKTKRSAADIRKEYFTLPKLSDAQKKEFYDQHKDKIPYSFDIIKNEIEPYIADIRKEELQIELIRKISREKNVKNLLPRPIPGILDIDKTGYASKGARNAKVQIIEFGDFTCPYCKSVAKPLAAIVAKHSDKVELTFRYFFAHPSPVAEKMAVWGHCALMFKKFWEYHDYIYEKQIESMFAQPKDIAKQVGINVNGFEACAKLPESLQFVKHSHEEGMAMGVNKTPTIYINGTLYNGPLEQAALEKAVLDAM